MGYIKPPPPADDEVIVKGGMPDGSDWTWGDHRAMEKSLEELEASDATVKEARQRLDRTLMEHGFSLDVGPVILVCEYCRQSEYVRHEESCPDYFKDLPVTREAGAYQWLNDRFEVIHHSSVCVNDEEACDYFRIVAVWFANETPKYLMRREVHGTEFKMLPWQYDKETGAVTAIGRDGK